MTIDNLRGIAEPTSKFKSTVENRDADVDDVKADHSVDAKASQENTACLDFPFELSIVIPTFSRPYQVLNLVQTILAQRNAPHTEVLVVSNLEDSILKRSLAGYEARSSPVRVLTAGRVGVNIARNIGLLNARGKIILFVDDDCQLQDSYFLRKHVDLHLQNPNATAIGGRYSLAANSNWCSEAYQWIADRWLNASALGQSKTLHLLGGNSSFKSHTLKSSHTLLFQFEEDIQFGGSETELQLRLTAASCELLLFENLTIRHECKINSISLATKAFRQGRTAKKLELFREKNPKLHFKPLQLDSTLDSALQKPSRAARLGVWIYRRSFEFGENNVSLPEAIVPNFFHWIAYFFSAAFGATMKLWLYPFLREVLYVLRISYEKSKRSD